MDETGSVFDLYEDAAAITELGPLFKLTRVCLWDDGRRTGGDCCCKGPKNRVVGYETARSPSGGDELLEEDADLAKEMAALDLPVSFKTTKKNKRGTKGKQSNVGSRLGGGKHDFCGVGVEDEILEEHRIVGQPTDEVLQNAGITMTRPEDGISKLSSMHEIEERDRPQLVENSCNEESKVPEWSNTQENGINMEDGISAEGRSSPVQNGICMTDDLNGQSTARKRKKKVRKPHSQKKVLQDHEELSFPLNEEYSADIEKYWWQRHSLFSRFDSGVKMDEEGWFSVTPETIAKHHAFRCTGGVVVDGFSGVGGNAIQFTRWHVIAVDIDPKKIEYAQHNAIIYEVGDQIDFIKGDFFNLASKLKADIVFLSPPWGGPNYSKVKTYDLKTMLKPHDGFFLFHTARKVASQVVMYLPKNVDRNQLAEIALSIHPPWVLEVERNYLNGKLKAVTAYFTKQERVDGNCITG